MMDGQPRTPGLDEFIDWPPEQVAPYLRDKTVSLATSGTSRWYFLEHGDPSAGYDTPQQFEHYGRHVISRVLELAGMIFADGVRTLFIVGFGGGQAARDAQYRANMKWVYELLIDATTRRLYDEAGIGVRFRGDWHAIFAQMDAIDLTERFLRIEEETAQRERWLIWFVPDEVVPARVIPALQQSLKETGRAPSRRALCEVYYGRPLEQVDILIGNNKPILSGVCPPLMTLRDAYFTVSPITYLECAEWRRILYDSLFSRRGHYRDFKAMTPDDVEEMRAYYQQHRGDVLGLGAYHSGSQTWRPLPLDGGAGGQEEG